MVRGSRHQRIDGHASASDMPCSCQSCARPTHVMHVRAFLGVSDRWRLQRILAWPLRESESHRDRLEPSAMHYDVDVCVCDSVGSCLCHVMLVRACVRCVVSPSACSSPHVLVCMLVCACMRASVPHSDSSCISSASRWRGANVCGVSWARQRGSVLARRSSFCRASASAVKRARCRSNLWWGARGAMGHGLEQHIQCMCAWKVGRRNGTKRV